MDINKLFSLLEENEKDGMPFVIKLSGNEERSPFSGRYYIYAEFIAYSGYPEIEYEYQILHHTESDIVIYYNNDEFKISHKKIRPYLSICFEKRFSNGSPGNIDERFREIFNEAEGDIKIAEYGLSENRSYYALFRKESYYLPPGKDSDKPIEKTNLVLMISDRPLKNGKPEGNLTPYFNDFTY